MKIESVHIENFGKLSNFDLALTSGLNIFKEDNGWGKSTLTVFIRVMFYGFEGEGKHGEINNERSKYTPWQGGAYGGSLVFETKGTRYLLTRTFGSKKAEDFFELRNADTNLISDKFSSEIGKELFHINSESFMKTVFIGQNDCQTADSTDDINSRIGNISDTTDMNKYQTADSLLTQAINKFSTRKNCDQWKIKERITELNAKVQAGSGIESAIDEINSRLELEEIQLDELKAEQDRLNERRIKATKLAEIVALKKEYHALSLELNEKREECEKEKNWFPKDVPTAARLEEWEKCREAMLAAQNVAENITVTAEEEKEFEGLSLRFSKAVPDEAVNLAMQDKANELYQLRRSNPAAVLSDEDIQKLEKYEAKYNVFEKFNNAFLRAKETYKSKYVNKCSKLTSMIDETARLQDAYGSTKKKDTVGLVLGFIFAALFVAMGFAVRIEDLSKRYLSEFSKDVITLLSGAFFIIGILILLIMFISNLFKSDKQNMKKTIESKTAEIVLLKNDIEATEDELDYFFKTYSIPVNGGNYEEAIDFLSAEREEFRYLDNHYRLFKENDKTEECNIYSKNIHDYLLSFGVEADEHEYASKLASLTSDVKRYKLLEDKINRYKNLQENSVMSVQNFRESLALFGFETKNDLNQLFSEIRKHIATYSDASKLLSDVIMRTRAFEASHDMTQINAQLNDEDYATSDELNAIQLSLDERRERLLASKKTDVDNLESLRDKYESYLEALDELEEEKTALAQTVEKFNLASKTQQYLSAAKEKMTARYVNPLKSGFDKYYGFVSGEDTEDFILDANLNLTKKEKGIQRKKESLSLGYRDLIGLCMRLSMADTMYKGEKPLLVLDDPFVNLDDDKVKAATKLLQKTEESYQIIYMTCREDRLIENVTNE